MNKEQFDKEISDVEVPKKEIFIAIDKGIEKGRNEKRAKRKSKIKIISTVTSVAASAFLASGLIFAPISNALASVPVIGTIYEKFGLQIGHELSESNLITQINQVATSNGVDIKLTSAYYDGNVIGITFNAIGDKLSLDNIGDKGPETGYNFHIFDGDEQNQWSSTMTQLEETAEGYIAAMEFYNPDANLSENYTLPLTFSSITGVNGIWKFDVPVKQIPLEVIKSQAESKLEGQEYSLKMESVVKGKATTLLNYQTTLPLNGENDEIRITVLDNEGNSLSKNHADVLASEQKGSLIEQDIRELFSSNIHESIKYLTIQPEIVRYEKDTIDHLNQTIPFEVKSKRFEYNIKVTSIKQAENRLIVDYTIQNVDNEAIREDVIQNFADFIMLIKSDDIHKNKNGELDTEKTLEDRIRSTQAKVMNDSSLHYQSIFNVEDADKLEYEDYSLIVPFGTLSGNQPIEMNPIKVNLTEK